MKVQHNTPALCFTHALQLGYTDRPRRSLDNDLDDDDLDQLAGVVTLTAAADARGNT